MSIVINFDIFLCCYCVQGNTLYFETADQPLPDVIKLKPVMALRIYDVDNEAKKSILLVVYHGLISAE